MNRLRGRKNPAEEKLVPDPSVESKSSVLFRLLGRSGKTTGESVLKGDVATALPPSDDFRTSLLLTALSDRFSILREQDDLTHELRKEGDDGTLYTKRQSRQDFGLSSNFQGIAKDSATRCPPTRYGRDVTEPERAYASESVMNRGKPIKCNNFFGDRHKIPAAGAAGGYRRALCDSDAAQSPLECWRQPKEEERTSFGKDQSYNGFESGSVCFDSLFDFDRPMKMCSTASPGPRRSMAATSSTSQPAASIEDWQPPSAAPSHFPEHSRTRIRRLYEQSLNERMQEHHSSVRSRIDTLLRGRFSPHPPELPANACSPTKMEAKSNLQSSSLSTVSKSAR